MHSTAVCKYCCHWQYKKAAAVHGTAGYSAPRCGSSIVQRSIASNAASVELDNGTATCVELQAIRQAAN